MFYGYALYYKDVDGYELPLFHRTNPHEIVLVTPYKDIAQKWFDDEHTKLHEELNPKPWKTTEGFWFWKKEVFHTPKAISSDEFRFKARVFNTLFVKRVKLA